MEEYYNSSTVEKELLIHWDNSLFFIGKKFQNISDYCLLYYYIISHNETSVKTKIKEILQSYGSVTIVKTKIKESLQSYGSVFSQCSVFQLERLIGS